MHLVEIEERQDLAEYRLEHVVIERVEPARHHATGTRVRALPITLESLLA